MDTQTKATALHVRTDLRAGESAELNLNNPVAALGSAVDLCQTAAQVANNALTDPDALKSFINYLPAANA
ncbi:MAG: hypothetical protein M5U05_14080 [Anaerolineales bacterium]|nr:hypothetical protein [Anaerolineales bacterium]